MIVLCELLQTIQLARGRLDCWRAPKDLMARITPPGPRSMLLESKLGRSRIEHKHGQLKTVLMAMETDEELTKPRHSP